MQPFLFYSDNEAHRIHKAMDKRCIMKISFECPSCEKIFDQPDDLEQHMLDHDQDSSLILHSSYSTGLIYVKCKNCGKTFQNEYDMKHHQKRVHEYGEICQMYPCDECAFSAVDMTELETHKGNYHVESLLVDDFDIIPSSTMLETHGRIQHNLKDIDFSYDSGSDKEKIARLRLSCDSYCTITESTKLL